MKKQKQKLLDLRDTLVDQMNGVARDSLGRGDDVQEASAFGMHQADAGSDAYDRDFALNILSQEQDALHEIEEALIRIDSGEYGICQGSGEMIPQARLEAMPFARCTVEYQERLDAEQTRGLVAEMYQIELADALHMASGVPAGILGLGDKFGAVEIGRAASLTCLDSDLTTPEAEALEQLLAAGKPVLLVANRADVFSPVQRRELAAAINRRCGSDEGLVWVAAAPRQRQMLADGRVRSVAAPPLIEPLLRQLDQLLAQHGELLLALNSLPVPEGVQGKQLSEDAPQVFGTRRAHGDDMKHLFVELCLEVIKFHVAFYQHVHAACLKIRHGAQAGIKLLDCQRAKLDPSAHADRRFLVRASRRRPREHIHPE